MHYDVGASAAGLLSAVHFDTVQPAGWRRGYSGVELSHDMHTSFYLYTWWSLSGTIHTFRGRPGGLRKVWMQQINDGTPTRWRQICQSAQDRGRRGVSSQWTTAVYTQWWWWWWLLIINVCRPIFRSLSVLRSYVVLFMGRAARAAMNLLTDNEWPLPGWPSAEDKRNIHVYTCCC